MGNKEVAKKRDRRRLSDVRLTGVSKKRQCHHGIRVKVEHMQSVRLQHRQKELRKWRNQPHRVEVMEDYHITFDRSEERRVGKECRL